MENFGQQIQQKTTILLFILMLIGVFLRFYNLNWGAPYYFHPDERNIISSVTQLRFPDQTNPHFFAYGSIPIYTIYGIGVIQNIVTSCFYSTLCPITKLLVEKQTPLWNEINIVTFNDAILIARSISAFFSLLLIPLVFIIGKKVHTQKTGLLSAFFTVTSVGLLQYAHFATFELWLTFFSVLALYYSLKIAGDHHTGDILILGVLMGILVGIKISSLVLLPLPFLAIFYGCFRDIKLVKKNLPILGKTALLFMAEALCLLLLGAIIFMITNPFVLLDVTSFQDSIDYEVSVANGSLIVFYNQLFRDTIPGIYQLFHVYPFLINPLLTFLLIPTLLVTFFLSKKEKNTSLFFVFLTFMILFISQAFLFVKWVRYMIPTLPFFYVMFSVVVMTISTNKKFAAYRKYLIFSLVSISSIYTFSYFVTVIAKEDTRLQAKTWIERFTSTNKKVLSESYDPGSMAFTGIFSEITYCNIYDLEIHLKVCEDVSLEHKLKDVTYILLPSERVVQSRLVNKKRFPRGYNFYTSLFTDKESYKLVYKTPCDIFCKILYMGNKLLLEQTAYVFDRPTVYVFEKIKQ